MTLIAIACKVIVLDLSKYYGVSGLAVAALIIDLAGAPFISSGAGPGHPAVTRLKE